MNDPSVKELEDVFGPLTMDDIEDLRGLVRQLYYKQLRYGGFHGWAANNPVLACRDWIVRIADGAVKNKDVAQGRKSSRSA
jgi:hypothetical protein